MANLRFVYRKSALKLGTVAVRILLENASFRQALKPVRTSKLTFPRVIWRHPAKHPLGFRVVLVTTASIHLQMILNYYSKNRAFRQLPGCARMQKKSSLPWRKRQAAVFCAGRGRGQRSSSGRFFRSSSGISSSLMMVSICSSLSTSSSGKRSRTRSTTVLR